MNLHTSNPIFYSKNHHNATSSNLSKFWNSSKSKNFRCRNFIKIDELYGHSLCHPPCGKFHLVLRTNWKIVRLNTVNIFSSTNSSLVVTAEFWERVLIGMKFQTNFNYTKWASELHLISHFHLFKLPVDQSLPDKNIMHYIS